MPWGYWLPRLSRGVDIRTLGSGNPGATNVWRTLGFKFGIAVALLDIGKGAAAALLGLWVGGDLVGVLAGVAAMIGHWRPLFLGFARGGKMVATTGGVALAVAPLPALTAAAVWIVVFFLTRYASVARSSRRSRCRSGRSSSVPPGRSWRSPPGRRWRSSSSTGRTSAASGRRGAPHRASPPAPRPLGLEAIAPDPAPPLESRLRAPK